MGRKQRSNDKGLGASIMRRRHQEHAAAAGALSPLHVADTFVESSNPLESRTDVNDLEEFMAAAVLSDRNFEAEKEQNIVVLPTQSIAASHPVADTAGDSAARSEVAIASAGNLAALNALESRLSEVQIAARKSHAASVVVPRRPAWTADTTPGELDMQEKAAFLDWRRGLAGLEENKELLLTPFEKNLEVWRMLWRVVERSQIVTQIVDARNPLMFRCVDLEAYVRESGKENLLLVNKSDLLSDAQKAAWAKYFEEHGVQFLFFSAKVEMERQEAAAAAATAMVGSSSGDSHAVSVQSLGVATTSAMSVKAAKRRERKAAKAVTDAAKAAQYQDKLLPAHVVAAMAKQKQQQSKKGGKKSGKKGDDDSDSDDEEAKATAAAAAAAAAEDDETAEENELREIFAKAETPFKAFPPTHVYSATELRGLLEALGKDHVGMVGYPNVGKSSTINCLFGAKKTSVGATPGKTKHFQTLWLTDKLCLCDCPGLVFPSFVATKAEMVVNGILPIDQMRDHRGPMTLVAERIPRRALEAKYGIVFPPLAPHEDPNRPPTAEELACGYGNVRGFMTQRGTPDEARASRVVLKDYINGRLLWANPPPGTPLEDADKWLGSTDAGDKVATDRPRGAVGELELDSVRLATARPTVPVGAGGDKRAFAMNKKAARKAKREARGVNPYATSGLEAGSAMNHQESVQARVQGRNNIQSQIGRNAAGGFARVNHSRRGGLS